MLLIPLSNYMFLSVLAPGIDCLNAKLLKADTVNTESILLPLEKKIPEDWSQGIIIRIPKKGAFMYKNIATGTA